jgi:hypothetical protein
MDLCGRLARAPPILETSLPVTVMELATVRTEILYSFGCADPGNPEGRALRPDIPVAIAFPCRSKEREIKSSLGDPPAEYYVEYPRKNQRAKVLRTLSSGH